MVYIQNPELLRGLQNAAIQQNSPVQYLQAVEPQVEQPAQYINQAITPSAEKVETPQEMNQQYNGAKYQLFKDNFPIPSPREFNMQNQIFEQKLLYDEAQKKYAKATTDDEKNMYKSAMDDATTNANVLRNTAQRLGWDTTGFGADNSLGEAVQAMNLNRNRGMAQFADMPSTAAQKRQVYENARQLGYSPSEARDIAERHHDEFRENNINRLTEGIGAYGLNPDGSLNNFGQMLMGKLYNESPYAYGNIVNGFANPKDVFNVNANMAQAAMNNQSAWDRMVYATEASEKMAKNQLQQRDKEFESNRQLDWAKFYSDLEYRNNVLRQNELERWSKTPEGQFKGWRDLAELVRIPENERDSFATSMMLSQSMGGRGSSNSGDEKIEQAYNEIKNTVGNQFIRLQEALENGDTQKAEEIWTGIDTLIGDTTFKNYGLLTPDDMNYITERQRMYRQILNGEMTLEEAQSRMGKPSYTGGNDQKMAEYQNNPDKLNTEIDNAIEASDKKKAEQEQRRQNTDKAAKIQSEYGETGIYKIPNAKDWEMPERVAEIVKTPRISVDSAGNRIVTNWAELSPEQRMELLKNGYNGGGYYAGR